MHGQLDWILFDADHTILDFERSARIALEVALKQHGYSLSLHDFSEFSRLNRQQWTAYENGEIDRQRLMLSRFELFFAQTGMQIEDIAAFNQGYLRALSRHPFYLDMADELLDRVGTHYNMGIITNGAAEVQRPRFEKSGLHLRFSFIAVSGELGKSKPNADYFEHVYEEMNFPEKDRVLVVGDSLGSDIRGGNQFGFRTCWYNAEGKTHPEEIAPDYVVRSHLELMELLEV